MTATDTDVRRPAARALPPVDRSPLRRARNRRIAGHVAAVAVSAFFLLPLYLAALAAFSSQEALDAFPKSLAPQDLTFSTMRTFLTSTGVVPAFGNSVVVGLSAVLLSLLVGAPAGYALARRVFRGRDAYQLFLLLTRALPVVVLSIPLAQVFLSTRTYDTAFAVILLHTALALPTTVLITASVFVAVPRDLEEAALLFGAGRLRAFREVVAPLTLPGLAAASMFTFVLSWNEVLGASVLTLGRRTLPAQVLASLQDSPLDYRFAGGFALVVPSLLFVLVMRRYLFRMWSGHV